MEGFLQLRSQEAEELAAASRTQLPPLQSILELTTAHLAPSRAGEAVATEVAGEEAVAAPAPVGRQLADGQGVLADGTHWEKKSGEELGEGGFWKRWTLLKGWTEDGTVAFEECWWESSDWAGMKELGATKSGHTPSGSAWRETWCEKAYHDAASLQLTVHRSAHKWAQAENGDEWEEKWGETHAALGAVTKYADKWAKDGANVWHEKWGEEYDGQGACTKWTDKWAERLLPGGAREQWGDKWTEGFGGGRGEKHGEVWSIAADGHRYNRWWNEGHLGDGRVRKWGDSTAGEYWDSIEHMDTYYNPVPHFGFSHAVRHSEALWRVPERPRRAGGEGQGTQAGAGEGAAEGADEALWGGLGLLNGDGAEEEEAQQQLPSGSLPSQPGTVGPAATPGMPPPASQPEAGADEDERFTLSGSSLTIVAEPAARSRRAPQTDVAQ